MTLNPLNGVCVRERLFGILTQCYIYCRPAPKNEDEMMVAIFEYIDRLFNIVRPRRLLYMAIDGVVSTNLFVNLVFGIFDATLRLL